MIIDEYEVCDRCQKENPEHELPGKKHNSYQLCDECAAEAMELIDKFIEEGENK